MTLSNVWLVRSGEAGAVVDPCLSNGVSAVRFAAVGDVRERDAEQVLEELKLTPGKVDFEGLRRELLLFAREISINDIILTSDRPRKRFYLGRVTSDYHWVDKSPVPDMKHLHDVAWHNYLPWEDAPEEFDAVKKYRRSVLRLDNSAVQQACNETIETELSLTQLLAKPTKWLSKSAATQAANAAQERLCKTCGLHKRIGQFVGASESCVDCE